MRRTGVVLLLLLLLLLLLMPGALLARESWLGLNAEPRRTEVRLDSDPPGASVRVANGRSSLALPPLVTPTVVQLEPGSYSFEFKREGCAFVSAHRPVKREPVRLFVTLPPSQGALRIWVEPAAATLTVDGSSVPPERRGFVPVAVGPHRLEAHAPGWREASLLVEARLGLLVDVPLRLSPAPARKDLYDLSPEGKDRMLRRANSYVWFMARLAYLRAWLADLRRARVEPPVLEPQLDVLENLLCIDQPKAYRKLDQYYARVAAVDPALLRRSEGTGIDVIDDLDEPSR